ncbi:MAG: nucleoside deaminase [Gammaproteobacteria bacterium]
MDEIKINFMREAIRLAEEGSQAGHGGPFGAIIVCENRIVGKGYNQVVSSNDPTAHAEIQAIRMACQTLQTFKLENCEIYSSCEPCPMCLSAIYWARLQKIYFAATRHDAKRIGFDDAFLYEELVKLSHERQIPVEQLLFEEALTSMLRWEAMPNKTRY